MNNVSFYFFVISIPFCFVNCFQLVAAKGRRREKKKSCFADLFLDGWRRPSGVSILDCTLSKRWVSFFFFFFYRSFQIFTCREKKKEKLFFFAWFLSYVSCTNEKKEEVQGEVHLVQFNRAAGDGSSQRRREGGGLDIYMYIYFLYVYPPTHLTDPQRTSKTLFVCVCVPVGKLEAISP